MKKLEYIETFVEVVQVGSFAKAAIKLNLTAAAVGKQIQVLEERMGHQLLHRLSKGVELTDAGVTFYDHALKIVNGVNEAQQVLDDMKGEPRGRLTIAANGAFCERQLIPHISEFIRRYPHVYLDIQMKENYPNLEKESIDVLFDYALNNPEALEIADYMCRTVGRTRFVLCASPRYLNQYGRPEKLEDLIQHRYISHSHRKDPTKLQFANGKVMHLQPFMLVDFSSFLVNLALDHLSIIWVEYYEAKEALEKNQLVELLPELSDTNVEVGAYYRKTKYPVPKIRAIVDFMLEKYAEKA